MTRGALRRLAQLAILAVLLWIVGRQVHGGWQEVRSALATIRPRWSLVALAVACVLAIYTVQIHAWRTLVAAWGGRLAFWRAARVWTVSNLSRFAPASVLVTTGVMGALGRQAGVPAAAAAGAAVLGTLLNLGTGAIIVVAMGTGVLHALLPTVPIGLVVALAIVGGIALLALPWLVPWLLAMAGRLTRRDLAVPPLPLGATATAVTANLAAWFLYGAANLALIRALYPSAGGGWVAVTAVFTGAYVAGWLAVVVPGGLGVREGAIALGLAAAGVLPTADALVFAVASRLLLSVLELLPGALFLASDALSRTPSQANGPS